MRLTSHLTNCDFSLASFKLNTAPWFSSQGHRAPENSETTSQESHMKTCFEVCTSLNSPTIIPYFANDETEGSEKLNEFTKLKTNDKQEGNNYLAKLMFKIHKNKTFRAIKNKDKSHKKLQKLIHRRKQMASNHMKEYY